MTTKTSLKSLRKNYVVKFNLLSELELNENRVFAYSDKLKKEIHITNLLTKNSLKKFLNNDYFKELNNQKRRIRDDLKTRYVNVKNVEIDVICKKTNLRVKRQYSLDNRLIKSLFNHNSKKQYYYEIKKLLLEFSLKQIKELRERIKTREEKLTCRQRLSHFRNRLKPISTKKIYTGIELECFGDSVDVYHLDKVKTWYDVKTDSSIEFDCDRTWCDDCDSDTCGCYDDHHDCEGSELVVLTRHDKFEKDCDAINSALQYLDVNSTCGLHVHLDVRKTTGRKIDAVYFNLVQSYRKFLRLMLSPSRHGNDYCKDNESTDIENQFEVNNRYYAINVESIEAHNTIEVRCHQGTTNGKKVFYWITLLNKIADYTGLISSEMTRDEIFNLLQLDSELVEYIESRIKKFN